MNKNKRVAFIADNYDSKDISKKIKVEIILKDAYKPFTLSQTDGVGPIATLERTSDTVGYNLSVDTTFTPKRADADVLNALVDEVDSDRYIYIGHIQSAFLKTVDIMYYDSKYKDMFIIPDAETILAHSDSTIVLTNYVFEIKGRAFVSNLPVDMAQSGAFPSITLDKNSISNFPIPQNIPGIASHVMLTSDLFNQSTVNNSGIAFGDRYVEGHFGKWIEFISLGSTDNLFGAGSKHTSFMLRRISRKRYGVDYIGEQVLDDILLPRI